MGGFSIGYGIGISPRTAAFDADALAYFATAGVTDPTAQIQINDFVKGIKDLGLWSSMVSWPLRSSQNKGSGTTAYSLGGLGTYNGTLLGTSLPTWNTDGLNFSSSASSRVSVSPFSLSQPFSAYACNHFSALGSGGAVFTGSLSGQPQIYNFGALAKATMEAAAPLNSNATFTALQKCFISAYFNGANSEIGINNSQNTGNAGAGNFSNLIIGNNFNSNYAGRNIEIAFLMFISNSSINSSVYSLYKTTLGQGLGLP